MGKHIPIRKTGKIWRCKEKVGWLGSPFSVERSNGKKDRDWQKDVVLSRSGRRQNPQNMCKLSLPKRQDQSHKGYPMGRLSPRDRNEGGEGSFQGKRSHPTSKGGNH